MKKCFLATLACIAMISAPAMADTVLHSSKHHIRITKGEPDKDGNETYIYMSWNKPRLIDKGLPDFEIKNGFFSNNYYGMMEGLSCNAFYYEFKKGDTTFVVEETLSNVRKDCFPKAPPKNAEGLLTIYIKGKEKAHYWLFKD